MGVPLPLELDEVGVGGESLEAGHTPPPPPAVVCTLLALGVLDGALTTPHPRLRTHTVTRVGLVQAPGPRECLSPPQPLRVGLGDVWGLPGSNANTRLSATTSGWRGGHRGLRPAYPPPLPHHPHPLTVSQALGPEPPAPPRPSAGARQSDGPTSCLHPSPPEPVNT